jgi:TRAP-type C4-dicarboxylate transport system substrate-binding protein
MHPSLLFLFLSISLFFVGCGGSDSTEKTYQLRLAATVPASDVQGQVLEMFKERLESASEGRLQVRLFLNGALGSDTELLQKTQLGVLEGCHISTSNAGLAVEGFRAFDLPFLLSDSSDNEKAFYPTDGTLSGPLTDRLQAEAMSREMVIGWVR